MYTLYKHKQNGISVNYRVDTVVKPETFRDELSLHVIKKKVSWTWVLTQVSRQVGFNSRKERIRSTHFITVSIVILKLFGSINGYIVGDETSHY